MRKRFSLAAAGIIAAALGSVILLPATANAASPQTVGGLTANSVPTTPTSYFGSGAAGETVAVSIDGTQQCSSTVGENGQWSCVGKTLTNGDYTADVAMSDGQFAVIGVTVDGRAWSPVYITSITGGTANRPVMTGTAEPGSRVRVSVDGLNVTGLGVTADSQGNWTAVANQDVASGSHVFVATQSSQSPAFQSSSDRLEFEVLPTPIVDPKVAGVTATLAGLASLAVVLIRRRRAA